MVLLFVLAVCLFVLALVLLGAALAEGDGGPGGVSRGLALVQAMTAQAGASGGSVSGAGSGSAERPFAERVLAPMRARALRIGRRASGADTAERIRRKLDLAGNPAGWGVDRVVSGKVLAAAGGLVAGLLASAVLGLSLPIAVVAVLALATLGFFGPDLYLYQKAYDRTEQLRRTLADAVDLLTISVEAGLGFDAAMQQVARNTEGPLGEEFSRVLREMQIGKGRAEALRALGDRTNVTELRTFVGAMVQAESFGIPIAQVLRVQSAEMRVKRRQQAEELAQKVPVKITVPLIFCILPCLFVAVMGPAALSIMDTF